MPKFDTHVCLVSAQATPNLMPLLDERWRPRSVVLATSDAMKPQSQALAGVLRNRGMRVETLNLRDVYDYSALCNDFLEFLAARPGEAMALNVTGGTKLMAVAAQEVFRADGRAAFYVNIENDEIVFLSGGHSAPLQANLKIAESLRAHGYTTQGGDVPQITAKQRDLMARVIDHVATSGAALGQLNGLASQARDSLRCRLTEDQFDSRKLAELLALFADAGYLTQSNVDLRFPNEASRAFVNGGWLELHVLQVLNDLRGAYPAITDIAMNLQVVYPDGRTKNELDLAFMYRSTLHIIECKTANLSLPGVAQDGKATEAIYKMESLLKLGGLRTKGMVIDYRGAFAASEANRKRAQTARIEVLSGADLKDARGQLARCWLI